MDPPIEDFLPLGYHYLMNKGYININENVTFGNIWSTNW